MTLINPDFSETQDQVTPGIYKGIIRKGELREWPNDKGKYINWELETYGETEAKNNGRRIFHKTPVDGRGAFRLQQFYRAATGLILAGTFDTEALIGKQVQVTIIDGINRQTGEPTGYAEIQTVTAVIG